MEDVQNVLENFGTFWYSIFMITVSKGILHVMLACKWRYTLLTRPHMSKKWGGGPLDCECGGRIVEVRSTKQSVIKVLTPKSYL